MTAASWWLRIVGSLYLIEGVGLTLLAWAEPATFAGVWASAPPESLNEVAVTGALIGGLPGTLTWVLLGALMWIYSRVPAQARVLFIVVTAWELLVWIPVDVVSMFPVFLPGRMVLSLIHAVIGISGIVVLRRLPKGNP